MYIYMYMWLRRIIVGIYKTYIGETHYNFCLYFSQSSARHIIRLRHRNYTSATYHFEAPQLIRKINSLLK
jgi:hypothetical protein